AALEPRVNVIETFLDSLETGINPIEAIVCLILKPQHRTVDVAELAGEKPVGSLQLADAALQIANFGFYVHGVLDRGREQYMNSYVCAT
ncbi:MAG: hypothetical protein Q8K85_15535, partial [Hyphomicrobium sp.]|nr:hypothetical protein [Hyphomicrobium sp.]